MWGFVLSDQDQFLCERPETQSIAHVPYRKVYGANMGPTWTRWAPCWPHKPCFLGMSLGHLVIFRQCLGYHGITIWLHPLTLAASPLSYVHYWRSTRSRCVSIDMLIELPEDIAFSIFLKENALILIKISLNVVLMVQLTIFLHWFR